MSLNAPRTRWAHFHSWEESRVLPRAMGRGANPAPHQRLGSAGQKRHPRYTPGHKRGTTFASRGQRNVNGNDAACCDCSVCPLSGFPELPGRGRESQNSPEVIDEGGERCPPGRWPSGCPAQPRGPARSRPPALPSRQQGLNTTEVQVQKASTVLYEARQLVCIIPVFTEHFLSSASP